MNKNNDFFKEVTKQFDLMELHELANISYSLVGIIASLYDFEENEFVKKEIRNKVEELFLKKRSDLQDYEEFYYKVIEAIDKK